MSNVASSTTKQLRDLLVGSSGLAASLMRVALACHLTAPEIAEDQIVTQNVGAELAELTVRQKYPTVYVYCEKLLNSLKEKFRTFSGKLSFVIEVRISRDRLEDLEPELQLYTDAATDFLDNQRGNWGNGVFYQGLYEVVFAPVKKGGRNYIQSAKVKFDVDVSRD